MGTAMKVLVVLLSVVLSTYAAEINATEFMAVCQAHAGPLPDTNDLCERGLTALTNVSKNKADFNPYLDTLGFVVPAHGAGPYNPLFFTAFDFKAEKIEHPYMLLLSQNANVTDVWTSFNILPGAMKNVNQIPKFLSIMFWQQYSQWMARNTQKGVPSLWLTGGTEKGYFPPQHGRYPSFWQNYELPNMQSDRVIIFHAPQKIVEGKRCNDQESYNRLHDTNSRVQYTCCELPPLSGDITEYGRTIYFDMAQTVQKIRNKEALPDTCVADLQQRFSKDKVAKKVDESVGAIVDVVKVSLLARAYLYEWRGKRQLASMLSSAVCNYFKNKLEEIAGDGRMHFCEEGGNLIESTSEGKTVRFTELLPSSFDAEFLGGLLLNNISYNCSSMTLSISTQVESLIIIPNILELSQVVLSFTATLGPSKEDLRLNALEFRAQWSVGGITGQFEITDDLDNSQLIIQGGPPDDSDVDLGALINNLAGEDVLGSSYALSDVRVQALMNMIEGGTVTVVVSGRFKQNTLYGIFQKTQDDSSAHYNAAFAADIDGAEFSELVKRVTGVDISGVPVLGSLSIPDIGITISTDEIRSPILTGIFSGESLLHISGGYISSGLTAYFNLNTDLGNVPVFISYSNKDFNFDFPTGFTFSFRSLLNLVPDLQSILDSVTLPPGIKDLLDIEINNLSVDVESGAISIDATYPDTLTFFDQLTITNLNVVLNAVLKSPRSITVEFSGQIGIADQFFDVQFNRNDDTGGYVLDVTIVTPPSLNDLFSLIPELGSLELPPGISDVLSLEVNKLSADFSTGAVTISASYPRPLSFLDGALTVQEASIVVVAVLKSPRSVSIEVNGQVSLGKATFNIDVHHDNQTGKYVFDAKADGPVPLLSLVSLIPGLGSLSLPPGVSDILDLTINDFSVDLDSGRLDIVMAYPKKLSFLNDALTVEGITITINAMVKSPRSVSITISGQIGIGGKVVGIVFSKNVKTGKYDINATIDKPINFNDLLSLIPEVSSLPLPPGIDDLLNTEIKDFSVDIDSGTVFIDATYPGTLTFFDQLTITNLNVVLNAILKSPRSITVEFSGQIGIASQIFDVQFNRNADTGGYILDVTIVTPPSLNDLLSLIPELGSLELPPGISDVLSLEVNKLSADFSTGAVTISASYPQPLSFLDGALTVQEASIVVVAVLKSPRSVSIEVTGQVSLGEATFNIDIHRDSQTRKYVFDAKADGPVPLLSLVSLIPGLGSLSLPPGVSDILDLTINVFSVDLDSGRLDIVVAYPKTLSFLNDALTVEGITITINAMVKSPRSVSITVSGQIGIGGKVVGIVFSKNVKTGKYGIDATIDKPINFNDLLSLIPEVNSLPLPPGIDDLLNTQIKDFSVDIDSGTVFIDATYPGTLTFFDQLTITNLNVVLNAILKSPRSITVEFSGQIGIASQIFDVQFNRNADTGGYILDVTIVTPPSLNDLLSLIPELGSLELPPGISDVLSLEVNKLSADFSTGAVTISASYPQPLSFLDGALTVQEASIVVVAVLKSPRSVSIEVTGQVSLGEATFNIDIHRDSQTRKYVFDAKADGPVPLLSLVSLIPGLGSLSLPPGVSDILDLTINDFSVDLDSGRLDIVVAYPKTLSFLNDALTVEGITITINAMVKSPRSVSITVSGQIGIGGKVVGIVFSKNVKTGKYGIDATIDKPINFNDLLSLIPEVNSLPLPPGIDDLLNTQIKDFSVDIDSGTVFIDATYPGTLTFFDQLTITNLNVVLNAILKSPRSITVEFSGQIGIASQIFDVQFNRNADTGGYILDVTIVTPPSLNDLLSLIPELGSLELPPGISDVLSLEVNKLSADFSTGAVTISASYPQPLSFLDGALTVQEASIVVVAVLKSPRSVSIEVTGQVSLGEATFNIDIHRDSQTRKYVFDAKADGPVPLLSLVSLIPGLGSLSLPPGVSDILDLTINDFSVDLDSGRLDIVVAYPKTLSFLNDALTVEGITITINAMVKSPRSVSITVSGQIGIGGKVVGIVFSKNVKTGKYGIDATIDKPINFNDLLSLIPEVNSLPLPPGIDDLLNTQIKDFSVDIDSGTVFIDATYPGTLTFFDQLTITNLNVVLNAILKSPRSITVEFSGQIGIASQIFDVQFNRNADTGGYILDVTIVTPPSLNDLLSLIPELGSLELPPGISDVLSLEVNKLSADFSTGAVTISASYPQPLSFLDGALTVQEASIVVVAVLKSPRSVSIEVTGQVSLGEATFNIDIHRDSQTRKYVFDAKADGPVPLLSLVSLIPGLGSLSLPPGVSDILDLTINDFSVDLDSGRLDIVVAYPKTLSFLSDALTVEGITVTINAMVKSPRSVSITISGQIGIGGKFVGIVFSKNVKTGKYDINATIDKPINFNDLLSLIPEVNSLPLPPGIDDLLNTEIKDFSVDIDSGTVFIDAMYPGTLTFFDQLTITNLNVVLNAVLKSPRSITVDFSGQIGIASQIFDVQFNRNDDTGGYVLDVTIITPPSINDLLSLIPELGSLELPPGISDVLSLEVNKLSADFSTGAVTISASYPQPLSFLDGALTVQEANIVVVAVLKSPRSVSIEVTGQVSLGEVTFNIDIHRDSQTGKYVFDAKADGPVPLLSLVSLIPDLGSQSLPPGVSDILDLTINDFSVDLDSGALDIVVAYPRTLSFLNDVLTVEGVTITINAIVKSPQRVSVTVCGQIGIGGEVFEIVFSRSVKTGKYGIVATINRDITLNSLLSLIPEVSSLPLPPFLSDLLNLQIDDFSVDLDKLEVRVDANYPGSLSFFDDAVVVNNPGVVIHAIFKSPRRVSLKIVGDIEIGGEDFSISITQDRDSGKYILIADIGRINIAKIVQEFGAAVVPDELSSIVDAAGFLQFAIDDAHITYPFGGGTQQIQLSGQPEIAGINGPHMSAIVIRQGGKNELIQGFEIGKITISDLIQKISGFSVSSIAILNQQLEAAILISPVTLPGVRLIGSKLSDFSINKGVSFQAAMGWPPDCSADPFCAVAQGAIGPDARFVLGGTIASAKSFTFSASVADLHLGSILLAKAGLEVTVGVTSEIGVFGSVTIPNPGLTLTGAIRVGTRGVVLEMTMTGCWQSAFGVKWLTICSLQVLVSLKPEVSLAGFAFGGEVKLGDTSCGRQVQAQGFIGIDPVSPQENYYYVNFPGDFTIGSILKAFCLNLNLPKPVEESGFPKGFLSSFSLFGKELPHVPLSIPQGYRLKGTLNILGLEASADITVGLPDGIKMDVSLPALSLDKNLLAMYAKSSDQSRGPFLVANITLLPRPSVNVEASGYLSVLGISRGAILRITNDAYMFSISGKFLKLFDAYLEITASYGDINSASFRVRGGFKNDLFSRIVKMVNDAIKKSASQATAKIDSAQRKVQSAQRSFDAANNKLSSAQRSVDSAQRSFDDAVNKLRGAENTVRRLCNPPSCGNVCVPSPCGTTCVARAWGRCVLVRPTFSSCCFRAPDVPCQTRRAACIALRETATAALKVARQIVDKSRVTLDAAKGVLEGAKVAVNAARHSLDVAKAVLEAAKQTYKAGVEAASALTRFALNDLFNIKEITFDVKLSVANGGSFACRVSARILGKNVNVSLQFNVRNISLIAKQLADKAIDGLSSFFG